MCNINIENILYKLDLNISGKFSKEKALSEGIVPIYIDNGYLNVISLGKAINEEYLHFYFGTKVNYEIVDSEKFNEVLKKVYIGTEKDMVKVIVAEGIRKKVSDIHFEPYKNWVNIRFRLNGDLYLIGKITKVQYSEAVRIIKLESNIDSIQNRKPQDGKGLYLYNDTYYDCRISTIPTVYGEKVVMRVLYGDKQSLDIDALEFSLRDREEIEKMLRVKTGMILVSGPTGSGKSTTLYSMLASADKRRINVTTIEDPIEIYLEGITQVALDRSVELGFSEALRSILRQDPDEIMVGEARDEETAKIAIRAALTGHKIYTTIHTKSPIESITRLEDMGIDNNSIRDGLVGIISQRLIKVLCESCKEEDDEKVFKFKVYKNKGCEKCSGTGYLKRRVVAACYFIDDKIKEMIKKGNYESDFLSNENMAKSVEELFKKGEIGYEDYKEFIYGEDLIRYDKFLQN